MADLPHVQPTAPAQPPEPGTRPALSAIDLVTYLCALFAVATLAFWGFTAWPSPWSIIVGIAAPLVALLLWALLVSPRAVLTVHPFVRAVVELCLFAAATIAWWSAGQAWIGLAFALVAIASGLISGRRRLA